MKKLIELFISIFKIGAFTFGGGYAMIPLIEEEVVKNKGWLSKEEFVDILVVAQSCLLYTSIDDRLLETPVIAAGQVVKETIRMSNKAKLSLELAMDAFMKNDENLAEKVYENEEIINNLEECITNYLVKLSKCELSDKEKNIVASTFNIVNDIERIGDLSLIHI